MRFRSPAVLPFLASAFFSRVFACLALGTVLAFASCSEDSDSGSAGETADSTAVADSAGALADSAAADSARADSASVDTTAADSTKEKLPEGVPVKVVSIDLGEIADYELFNSTVEAEETVDVYAQTAGLVEQVLVEEGDEVRKGDLVVQLVDDDLKLAEETARLSYLQKKNQFSRKEEIFTRKLLSKEEYEEYKFGLEQERIRWDRARLAMDHASVRVPAPGVVAERMVKLGDRISPGTKLFVLVDLRRLVARVHVSVKEIRRLRVGQRARISADTYPDVVFEANVIRISPVVDPASGTFKVTLRLDDSANRIRPGMFVNAHVVTEVRTASLLVPKQAVVYDDGEPHAFVVKDSTAQKVALTIGFENTHHLEALTGLAKGDSVVVVGQNGLKSGARVRVIPGAGLMVPAPPDSTEADSTARRVTGTVETTATSGGES